MSDGYAPDNPSGTPWPCPLSSPDPVTAADGTVTCTIQTTVTEHPKTGGPFGPDALLGAAAVIVLGVVLLRMRRRDTKRVR